MGRRFADPYAAMLDAMDQRARKAAPRGPVMGTVTSLSPLIVELDTGETIEDPVVVGTLGS